MTMVAKSLVGLSAVAFLLAVISNSGGVPNVQVSAEGFSRAAANLALLAIALAVVFRGDRVD